MDKGILYIAIGEASYREACYSASSARKYSGLPIILFTNLNVKSPAFDEIYQVSTMAYEPTEKIKAIASFPFPQTLFLDADTLICSNVLEGFDVLEQFDVAAVHQPNRVNWPAKSPLSFPEVNSGVLFYRNSGVTRDTIEDWLCRYQSREWKTARRGDQGALRDALYHSAARLCILPQEWNLRVTEPAFITNAVKILHGHGDLESIRQVINQEPGMRLYKPGVGLV